MNYRSVVNRCYRLILHRFESLSLRNLYTSLFIFPLPMSQLKTKQTSADVLQFIDSFANTEQKKKDSYELIRIMQEVTGHEPKMWGPSIIGFGQYHYKSERSRQEGDWPLVGFSPRKAAISLYVFTGSEDHLHLLEGLGNYKMGKACIYIRKLSDINQDVLEKLIKATIDFLKSRYGGYKNAGPV